MVRISALGLALLSSAALCGDKEDAERALQRLNPPPAVCYTLKVMRPVGGPEIDGKPRFVPLAPGLKSGVTGNVSTSCAGPGVTLKAAGK